MAAFMHSSQLGCSMRTRASLWLTRFPLLAVTLATYVTHHGSSANNDVCGNDWTYFGGYCYFVNSGLMTWNNSFSDCRTRSSYLVDIQSFVENAFVVQYKPNSNIWIGYNDFAKEGTFVWSRTEENGTYTNWKTGEPNAASPAEDCIGMSTKNNYSIGAWGDLPCNWSYPFVCKRDADECASANNSCHENATCTNTNGSYTCTCNGSFVGNGWNCTALNRFCNQSWTYFEGLCYFVNKNIQTWNMSKMTCASQNSNLLDIQSKMENDFVKDLNRNSTFWIGFNDISNEGRFVWTRTKLIGTYTNWETGEPNNVNGTEHCAIMLTSKMTGQWVNVRCEGSYRSVCKKDVNECTSGLHDCHANATCTNTYGSFMCTCKSPSIGNGRKCTDIKGLCSQSWTYFNGSCYFLNARNESWFYASLSCHVKNSYLIDIWSAAENDFVVRSWEKLNIWIGYNDISREGTFVWSRTKGRGTYSNWRTGEPNNSTALENCALLTASISNGRWVDINCEGLYPSICKKDLNECAVGTHACHANATCTNTIGSYTCTCKAAFSGNGTNCTDVNECTSESHGCHANATCTNTIGSYTCQCKRPFVGTGRKCTVTCPPEAPVNGFRTPGTNLPQTVAIFSCNRGYQLVGQSKLTCQSNGNWTAQIPNCTDMDECSSHSHNCSSHATCTNKNGSFICSCVETFTGDGVKCLKFQCSSTQMPQNGFKSSNNNSLGAIVSFGCNNGYKLEGQSLLKCLAGGQWNGTAPLCKDVNECSSQSNICSRNATCQNSEGSYSCTCNTKFRGDGVTCTKESCPAIQQPQNGWKSTNDTIIGTIIKFGCNGDYKLIGSSSLKCLAGETWDGTVPTCDGVCPPLQRPAHGFKSSENNLVGSRVTFSCNTGYKLSGISTLICQTDKEWSTKTPSCNVVNCPNLDSPTNGAMSGNSTSYKSRRNFTCNKGYKLGGSAFRECQSHGTWSGENSTCVGSGSGSSLPVVFIVVPVAVVFILVVLLVIYGRKRRSKRTPRGVIPSGLEMLSQQTSTNNDGQTTTENYYSSGEEALVAQNSATNDNLGRRAQTGAGQENERYSFAQPSEREVKVDSPSRTPRLAANANENPSDYDRLSRRTNSKSPHRISLHSTGLDAAADTYDHVDRSANQDTDSKDSNAKEALAIGETYSRLSRSAMNEDPNELTAPSFDQPSAATGNEQYSQLNRPNPAAVYSVVHKDSKKTQT